MCEGKGCDSCKRTGKLTLTSCPHERLDPSVWRAINAAQFAEKGVLPCAGGTLDQTQSAMDAFGLIWRDEAEWRKALKLLPI